MADLYAINAKSHELVNSKVKTKHSAHGRSGHLVFMRAKPDFVESEKQKRRPASASAQSGQRFCHSFYVKNYNYHFYM